MKTLLLTMIQIIAISSFGQKICLTPDNVSAVPDSIGFISYGASLNGKPWGKRELTVSFLETTSTKVKEKIIQYAKEWEKYANIEFVFLNSINTQADIRIRFSYPGNWSFIGTDSQIAMSNTRNASMNFCCFTDFTSDLEFKRTVLHEFGHALCLIHEQNSPSSNICWDETEVYKYYSGPPNFWDPEKTYRNVLHQYSTREVTNYTKYDPESIMQYDISNNLTTCDFEIRASNDLSNMDKKFIGQIYPLSNEYDGNLIKGMVAGNFDDNDFCDISLGYYYGRNIYRVHNFLSKGTNFEFQGRDGWWGSNGGYNGNLIAGVTSGDYNSDGLDDIANIYYYDNQKKTTIHVLLSDGKEFKYQDNEGWWNSSFKGYNAKLIKGIVSGDFNNDSKHDIAISYHLDNLNKTVLHVFLSDGEKFNYQDNEGWWISSPGGYNAKLIKGMTTGDFNNDQIDDIAIAYYYDNSNQTAIHVFLSDGDSFNYQDNEGWWISSPGGYNAKMIKGMTTGDYNSDQIDDIAILYYYDNKKQTALHVFLSDGEKFDYQDNEGWWISSEGGYNGNLIKGISSGDYNNDKIDDIAIAYYYDNANKTALHVFLSDGTKFEYQDNDGWWKPE